MTSKYTPKLTRNGVIFLNEFPQNLLRPHGQAETAPMEDVVFKRIKPTSCEWLKQPKVAMSEMADTLTKNMKMLSLTDRTTLLSIERESTYKKKLAPLLKYLENLNSKSFLALFIFFGSSMFVRFCVFFDLDLSLSFLSFYRWFFFFV